MLQLPQDVSTDAIHLNFEQTVPRALVHKRSHENVLLTDLQACADDRFICAGRVPTAHSFFNQGGRTPQKDILFYTELGRQASLATSHAFLGVSAEDVFIFEQSEAAVTEAVWKRHGSSRPGPVIVDIRILETARRKNNAFSRVVAEHIMSIAGEEVFRGTGSWTIQPLALFRRLRRSSTMPPVPLDPGNEPADNVVIAEPESSEGSRSFATSLIVDHGHPYFFDHPCDHVPGMLLLEACAQLAQTAFARTVSATRQLPAVRAYEVNFTRFVECGIPTMLTAHVNPDWTVHVTIAQQDVVAGTATITLSAAV